MAEEIMNNETEVTTEASESEETSSCKPSKGFIALVAGGIATIAGVISIAVITRKHKKSDNSDVEFEDEEDDSDWYDEQSEGPIVEEGVGESEKTN